MGSMGSMASQVQEEHGNRVQEWFIQRALDSAAYITLVLGYSISILAADHLTVTNVTVFTLINILYAIIAWRVFLRELNSRWWSIAGLVLLGVLTVASGLYAITGLWFNWLLYFVTVAIYFTLLPMRRAVTASSLLFIAAYINVLLLDGWRFINPDTTTLLPGFVFVAAFSYSNRLLVIQRKQTELVLRQLKESRREREEAHAQLQAYASEVEELTIDRERARMAREIHDTLGHYLTILTIQLETIGKLQERDPVRTASEVAEARRVAAQSMQEVRNAVAALRPTSIATLSLPDALTQLTDEFSRVAPGIALTLDLETQLPVLSPDQQLALYRAAQEALTNIRKHAHATKILLRLRYEDTAVELVVLNNGPEAALASTCRLELERLESPVALDESGTTPAPASSASIQKVLHEEPLEELLPAKSGFGLLGLRERIELLGGHVTYGPVEPAGYRLSVNLPLYSPEESTAAKQRD